MALRIYERFDHIMYISILHQLQAPGRTHTLVWVGMDENFFLFSCLVVSIKLRCHNSPATIYSSVVVKAEA